MKATFVSLTVLGLSAVAAWFVLTNAPQSPASAVAAPVALERRTSMGETLKPVVIIALPPASPALATPGEQATATNGTLIFYPVARTLEARDAIANRVVWQRPLPRLFTVVGSVLVTLEADSKLNGADAATLKPLWTLDTQGSDPRSLAAQTPALRGVGDRLLVAGFVLPRYSPGALERMYVLDPRQGTLAAKSAVALSGGYTVLEERYVAWGFPTDSPRGNGPLNVFDTATGVVRTNDEGTLNLTRSARESVFVTYPTAPPADQYPNVDGYRVRIEIRDTSPQQNLTQSLGTVQLGPRAGCYQRNLPVGVRAVAFLAADEQRVWLTANDACGNRIAQLERRKAGTFTLLDLPEATPLEARRRTLETGGTVVTFGALSAEQRGAILGEPPALAAVRAEPSSARLVWSAARGERVYALRNTNELTIYAATSGKLLYQARLALPVHSTPSASTARVEVEQRVLVWRTDSEVAFFVLPS